MTTISRSRISASLRALLVGAPVLAITAALASGGCLSLTHPPEVSEKTIEIEALNDLGPASGVDIALDDRGIPHINGASEEDIAFGLGFMHARDRLFQIELMRHAAQGRLTELFGEALLDTDRELRLLTYRLDDAAEALSPRDRAIAEAYIHGVNRGAEHAGLPAEMRLLRRDFAPYTVRDLMSILRLQAWQLSFDLDGELVYERIVARLPEGDPRREALLVALDTGGVSIIAPEEDARALEAEPEAPVVPVVEPPPGTEEPGAVPLELIPLEPLPLEPSPEEPLPPPAPADDAKAADAPTKTSSAEADFIRASLGLDRKGASNSWVVHGSKTTDGRPVLCNDPHLRHGAPSTMYLAHLEHADWSIAGATLPGLPAVVIGRTRDLAWGLTTSFVDAQDLARIQLDGKKKHHYVLDGKSRELGTWPQQFLVGGKVKTEETWSTTVFGPMLPSVYDDATEPEARYALMWVGFDPEVTKTSITGFWDLGRAKDIKEARAALEKVGAPSQNIVLAFNSGDIGYHLMGAVPRRRSAAPSNRPRDGRSSEAGWAGYLSADEKPSLENPESGYIVTANQRIVPDDDPTLRLVGALGTTPHRAQRIHQRIRALFENGRKADADALLDIQQDVQSTEAVRLAPLFAARCPSSVVGHPADRVRAFCEALSSFDGRYTLESSGPTVFTALLDELQRVVISTHLGEDVYKQVRYQQSVVMAIENAVIAEAAGTASPLFDDMHTPEREGLDGFLATAAKAALDRVVDEAGRDPSSWAWGEVHTLAFKSPLAQVPLIGLLFSTEALPEPGWHRAPRAEGGVPVRAGAVFRMMAKMGGATPEVKMTIDLGQSGHFGHPHFDDQRQAWREGKPEALPIVMDAFPVEGRFSLKPRAKVAAGDIGTSASR